MDGLKDTIPYGHIYKEYEQLSFDTFQKEGEPEQEIVYCRIFNWRANHSDVLKDLKRHHEE